MQLSWLRTALVTGLTSLFMAGTAAADPVADFYRDKQLSLIIPSGVGGGYDLYGRFLARFIGKDLGGNVH